MVNTVVNFKDNAALEIGRPDRIVGLVIFGIPSIVIYYLLVIYFGYSEVKIMSYDRFCSIADTHR